VLIIGISGTRLSDREREWIAASSVSGVILFARNFASRAQVTELVAQIRAVRPGPFLLSVDQEGGLVRRLYWAPPTEAPAFMSNAAANISPKTPTDDVEVENRPWKFG